MRSCAVRQGFLTLRECGEPAATLCGACARPVCAGHLSVQEGAPLCVECGASQSLSDSSGSGSGGDLAAGPSDDWRYGYRERFYRDTGYAPQSPAPLQGAGTFDDLDKEPFDQTLAETGGAPTEDEGPSLFDS